MKRARRGEGSMAAFWAYYTPGEEEQHCCTRNNVLHGALQSA
jgi:hypothetical protein